MQKLYTIYSASPKNRRRLEMCSADVGVQLLKIGRILDVRWSAPSLRTVKAVWTNYAAPALFTYFSEASNDTSLDSFKTVQCIKVQLLSFQQVFFFKLGIDV